MLTRYPRSNLSTVSLPLRYVFSRKVGVVNSLLHSFQEINHARGEYFRMSAASPARSTFPKPAEQIYVVEHCKDSDANQIEKTHSKRN